MSMLIHLDCSELVSGIVRFCATARLPQLVLSLVDCNYYYHYYDYSTISITIAL